MESKDYQIQVLENISAALYDAVKLIRVISHPKIKEILEATLDSNEKRLVYDMMDGEKTVATIQELSGVNVRFISEWGQEWEKLGLVEIDSNANVRGRRRKSFDLSLYDIQVIKNN
jgi:hypothetical protein